MNLAVSVRALCAFYYNAKLNDFLTIRMNGYNVFDYHIIKLKATAKGMKTLE